MKAAEQGYAPAQNMAGICHETGHGVSEDEKKAAAWYRKAAEQGYTVAQCNLGSCYRNGYGVAQDEKRAALWYRKAADQGYARAQEELGWCYQCGTGVSENEQKAFTLFEKAAEQGYAQAQYRLGYCYEQGIGTDEDEDKAFAWYKKAAELEHPWGQYALGLCYENGVGTEEDETAAIEWYRKAAAQGDEDAQERLEYLDADGEDASEEDTAEEDDTGEEQEEEQAHGEVETDAFFMGGDQTEWMYEGIRSTCELYLMLDAPDSFGLSYRLKETLGLQNENDADIYLAHDDTVFGTGKNGFAIAKSGLYCRRLGDRYTSHMSYREFARADRIYCSGSEIFADGTPIAYFTGASEDELQRLVRLYQSISTSVMSLRW